MESPSCNSPYLGYQCHVQSLPAKTSRPANPRDHTTVPETRSNPGLELNSKTCQTRRHERKNMP